MAKPHIQESRDDYLEMILMLSHEGTEPVKAVEVAKSLGFSKPSVSVALKKLVAEGYVYFGEHQTIHLTEEGYAIAKAVLERHEILTTIFVKLGVSPETAREDACRVEHCLSDETWTALKNHVKLG